MDQWVHVRDSRRNGCPDLKPRYLSRLSIVLMANGIPVTCRSIDNDELEAVGIDIILILSSL